MIRDPQAGFTLIESLVAMAVLALGAVALLTATEDNTARIADITERTAARWAGQYAHDAARLGVAPETGEIYGIAFETRIVTEETDDPALRSMSVLVFAQGGDAPVFTLDGYVRTEVRP